MKTALALPLALALCCACHSHASTPDELSKAWQHRATLDLSRSHFISDFLASDVSYYESSLGDQHRDYLLKAQSIEVRLPRGRSIAMNLRTGFVADNLLRQGTIGEISLDGPILPEAESKQIAEEFIRLFGLPASTIDTWRIDDQEIKVFSTEVPNHYPRIGIVVSGTMNPKYPTCVRIVLSWNLLPKNADQDEEWGWKNNPPPSPGLERISLDAPSGNVYDGRDAFVDHRRRQAELDRRLGQVRGPDGRLIATPKPPRPPRRPPEPDRDEEASARRGWHWLVLLASVVGIVYWWRCRRRRSSRSRNPAGSGWH